MKARGDHWGVRPVGLCAECGAVIPRPQFRPDGRFVCADCYDGEADGGDGTWTVVQRLVESGQRLPPEVR